MDAASAHASASPSPDRWFIDPLDRLKESAFSADTSESEMAEAISDHDRAAGRLDPAEAGTSVDAHEPAAPPARRPLGSLLTEGGFISESQLAEGLREGAATGARLGEVVVSRGWASEDDVAKLLAEQWQLGYVDRASIFFDAAALTRLPRSQARQLEALPTRIQDGHVVVAVAEPTEQRLAALRAVIGDDTVVVVVPKTALDAGLRSELLSGGEDRTDVVEEEGDESEPAAPIPAPAPRLPPIPPIAETTPAAPPPPAPPMRATADDAELGAVLTALGAVARDATTLQLSVGELAGRLEALVTDAAAAAARLEQSAPDEGEKDERIHQLEQQLAQRTEMTDGLKAQLQGLTRALDDYR